jgi:hypothetical protein
MANMENLMPWFKEKYNTKEYFFTFREYKTKSIIKDGIRYKVESICPHKTDDDLYFIVCRNTPVKEKRIYKRGDK